MRCSILFLLVTTGLGVVSGRSLGVTPVASILPRGNQWQIPRGGSAEPVAVPPVSAETASSIGSSSTSNYLVSACTGLSQFLKGQNADALWLLLVTGLNTPLCTKILKISPILGFLASGLLLGPNGTRQIHNVHGVEHVADLGIVLFLFEMGIHLDLKTLWSIRQAVFGIGGTQFGVTALIIAGITSHFLGLSKAASIIVGWSLALSSSAFVLQLLQDKKQMETVYGKTSFGTLLLQDLMVVPLLVMTPLLAGSGDAKAAILQALTGLAIALVALVGVLGQGLLNPVLDFVRSSGSEQALTGVLFFIVFGASFLTEGLGLSNTLGAFLVGMLMAETKHKHIAERTMESYRGILVGLFFFTVGFEINLNLMVQQPLRVAGAVLGILALKAVIATAACRLYQVPMATAQHVGCVLSQGGEFAFVAFRTARAAGILTEKQTQFLLTTVSLTMAATPFLEELGAQIYDKMEKKAIVEEQENMANLDEKVKVA